MAIYTININDKKSEKAVKAVLDALGLEYKIDDSKPKVKARALNKKEKEIYKDLKNSLGEIQQWERGEIKLKPVEELLNEL